MQAEAVAARDIAQLGHGLQIGFFEGALFHQPADANFIRRAVGHLNLHQGGRRVAGFAVQGINLPVRGDRMAGPLIAAADHHLVEPFQPAESVAALQVDKRRVNNLFDRRIPAHPAAEAFHSQQVHAPRRAEGDSQAVFTANGEDFAAFLLAAVQDFLLNAERMVFHLQLIAADLPVSFIHALFSTRQHPCFCRGGARNQQSDSRQNQCLFHFYSLFAESIVSLTCEIYRHGGD